MENYNPQNIELLKKRPRQRDRGRAQRYSSLKAKQKKVSKKSDKQRYLDIVLKKTTGANTTGEQVDRVLAAENLIVNQSERTLLLTAALNQMDVRSFRLAPNLLNKPISIAIYNNMGNLNFLTSDYLHLNYLAMVEATNIGFQQFVELDSIYVASKEAMLLNDNTSKFTEFYYEDLNSNVSSPNWFFTGNVADPVFSARSNFFINGVAYNRFTITKDGKEAICYTTENYSQDNALRSLNNMKKMYDKKELKLGMRLLSKSKGAYYSQMNLIPTVFCPSTLKFPENKTLNFGSVINYNVLPDKLLNVLNTDQALGAILTTLQPLLNLIAIDQLPSLLEFLSVVKIVFNSRFPINNQNAEWAWLSDAVTFYNNNSGPLNDLVKLYRLFEKSVLSFLDVFDTGISIDKMNNVLKYANDYVNDYDLLMQGDVEAVLTYFGVERLPMCRKYGTINSKEFAVMIRRIASTILNPTVGTIENLVVEIRSLGLALFDLLKLNAQPCLNKLRSPSSFLGNVLGGENYNFLVENLRTLRDKVNRANETIEQKNIREDAIRNASRTKINAALSALGERVGGVTQNVLNLLMREMANRDFYNYNEADIANAINDIIAQQELQNQNNGQQPAAGQQQAAAQQPGNNPQPVNVQQPNMQQQFNVQQQPNLQQTGNNRVPTLSQQDIGNQMNQPRLDLEVSGGRLTQPGSRAARRTVSVGKRN
jgi:hypothetical protein